MVSVAVQSIVQEKARHGVNATAGIAGVGATTITAVPDWLGIACAVAALMVSCAIFYKTYLDIKLKKIQLAKVDRRSTQRQQE